VSRPSGISAAIGQEHDGEPVRGLPGHLPQGEHILWQGAPDWRTLSRTAMRAHWVAIYFAVLAAWNLGNGLAQGSGLASAMASVGWTLAAGSIAVGLLVGYAVLVARTTVYTLRWTARVMATFRSAWAAALASPIRTCGPTSGRSPS